MQQGAGSVFIGPALPFRRHPPMTRKAIVRKSSRHRYRVVSTDVIPNVTCNHTLAATCERELDIIARYQSGHPSMIFTSSGSSAASTASLSARA